MEGAEAEGVDDPVSGQAQGGGDEASVDGDQEELEVRLLLMDVVGAYPPQAQDSQHQGDGDAGMAEIEVGEIHRWKLAFAGPGRYAGWGAAAWPRAGAEAGSRLPFPPAMPKSLPILPSQVRQSGTLEPKPILLNAYAA